MIIQNESNNDNDDTPNDGTLIMDATCAPADIILISFFK